MRAQCPKIKESHQFVTGELETEKMEQIEQHIDSCRWCRELIATIEESQRDPIVNMMSPILKEGMELQNSLYDETIAHCIQIQHLIGKA